MGKGSKLRLGHRVALLAGLKERRLEKEEE
jgi:hypothetical protein